MNQMHIESEDLKKIFNLVNNSSCSALQNLTKISDDDMVVKEINGDGDLSYDHWICCIVVNFEEVSVAFTVHFTSKDARAITSMGTGKSSSSLKPKTNHDFMKEYANLTAGAIKDTLQKCDFENHKFRETMLPMQKPSFDTVTIDEEDDHWISHWIISLPNDVSFICSSKVEVTSSNFKEKLKNLDTSIMAVDDDGEIEFF